MLGEGGYEGTLGEGRGEGEKWHIDSYKHTNKNSLMFSISFKSVKGY